MNSMTACALSLCALAIGGSAAAQDVRITTFKRESTFELGGRTFTISRNQDQTARVPAPFALTSRACPPDCIQPVTAAPGVVTFAELEVITFLEQVVSSGQGLLVDARAPDQFATGSIPGAVNIPHSTVEETNRYRGDILQALGAIVTGEDTFNFDNAMALTIYCDGPWSRDAFDTINHLVEAGYPAEKLTFYRAGMQGWVQLGLTVASTQTPG